MKITILLLITTLLASSCKYTSRLTGDKPYVELDGQKLTIKEFAWGYGNVRINEWHGDFKKLDEKVFSELKGRTGSYSIVLSNTTKDKYGNDDVEAQQIGFIDAEDLSKYKSWEFWHKDAGIKALLYEKYVTSNADSTEITYITDPPITPVASVPDSNRTVNELGRSLLAEAKRMSSIKTFTLTQTQLYPDPEDRSNQDYQSYTNRINGAIKAADFYNGTLEVLSGDGEYYALRLVTDNLPTSLKSDVRYFMKAGNEISCICTVAGARELQVVSVTFTSNH